MQAFFITKATVLKSVSGTISQIDILSLGKQALKKTPDELRDIFRPDLRNQR